MLADLDAGKTKVKIEIKACYEVIASGEFTIEGNDFDFYENLINGLKNAQTQTVQMPQAKKNDPALQKEMKTIQAEVDAAVQKLVSQGTPDKYREHDIPEKFKPFAQVCNKDNVARLLAGKIPVGVAEKLAAKTAKVIGYKAPVALKLVNEIIDQQAGKSMEDAVKIELDRLNEIFSTADALEGLSSLGRKRPEFEGA